MPSDRDALFTAKLLQRSQKTQEKDGSLGLETLVSLHQYHQAYRAVQQYIEPQSLVLDWGGGSGHFSYYLAQTGYQAHIYAFKDPKLVTDEIEAGTIKYTQGSTHEPTQLPYPNNYFAAVCSIGVLEHVREVGGDERASLQEIRRILQPGGVFICYHLPNRRSWIEFLARRLGRYSHAYTYDRRKISTIFDQILNIEKIDPYAFLPRNSMRFLPRFLSNSRYFSAFFDWLDSLLEKCFPAFTQNWLVIAKKPSHHE